MNGIQCYEWYSVACEQALLIGRAMRVTRERPSERRSRAGQRAPLACLPRVYVSRYPPNRELARRLGIQEKFEQVYNTRSL